jgi:hypothetical protein
MSPLTAAWRHPLFSDLYNAEGDFILSPPPSKKGDLRQGERNIAEFMF